MWSCHTVFEMAHIKPKNLHYNACNYKAPHMIMYRKLQQMQLNCNHSHSAGPCKMRTLFFGEGPACMPSNLRNSTSGSTTISATSSFCGAAIVPATHSAPNRRNSFMVSFFLQFASLVFTHQKHTHLEVTAACGVQQWLLSERSTDESERFYRRWPAHGAQSRAGSVLLTTTTTTTTATSADITPLTWYYWRVMPSGMRCCMVQAPRSIPSTSPLRRWLF